MSAVFVASTCVCFYSSSLFRPFKPSASPRNNLFGTLYAGRRSCGVKILRRYSPFRIVSETYIANRKIRLRKWKTRGYWHHFDLKRKNSFIAKELLRKCRPREPLKYYRREFTRTSHLRFFELAFSSFFFSFFLSLLLLFSECRVIVALLIRS